MRKLVFAVSVLFCFLNMKCEPNDEILLDTDNLLVGAWADPKYDNDVITFSRVSKLPDEDYGIIFKKKNVFIERSSGWCGTPPLVFSDYDGKWQLQEDVISVTQNHFPNHYAWKIVTLTKDELVVKAELTEQEQDYRALMDVFNDIVALTDGIACDNADDWAFTPYGAKACGGPQGFLAYSKHIDTDTFLKKIEEYTKMEKDYNIKWGIFSTCDVLQSPKGVICENGLPTFIF